MKKTPDANSNDSSSNNQKDQSDSKTNTGVEATDSSKKGASSKSDNQKEQNPVDNSSSKDKNIENVDKTTSSSESVPDSSKNSLNKKIQISYGNNTAGKTSVTKTNSPLSAVVSGSSKSKNVADSSNTAKNTFTSKLDPKSVTAIARKTNQKVQKASLPQTGDDKQNGETLTLWGSMLLASTVAFFGFGYMRKYKHFNK
ncbi:hypothetical protein [Liquorilactobacillus uvarum]|uniref:hypothetical protein n=2 Tax=Bacillati TaxID=1783272 RepID=UPI00288BAD3E|nr:hypothetical protein [Liquorilactobacillus uvarum]